MARNDEDYDGPTFPALRGITVVGNLTRDPKAVRGKNRGAGFGIALNSIDHTGFKGKMFLNCIAWEHQADQLLEHYGTGDKAILVGDLSIGEYDGEPQYNFVARQVAKVLFADSGDDDRGSRGSRGGSSRRNRDEDDGDEGRSSRRSGRSSRSSRDDDEGDDSGSSRRSGRSSRSSRDDDGDSGDEGRSSRRSGRSSRSSRDQGDDLDD